VPPDVQGAAGPDHLLAMFNTRFLAQRKSDGAEIARWTPVQFWKTVAGGDALFDPRVTYDALSARWIAVIATVGIAGDPAVLLAISDGTDPTAGWTFRKLPVGAGQAAEFPLVGGNARWIVVTSNLISGSGYLAGTAIWTIEKAPLLADGTLAVTRFTLPSPGSPVAPVVTFDPGQEDEFLLQQASGNVLGRGSLRLFRITGGSGQPRLIPPRLVSAPASWADAPSPIDALPQAATERRITSDQDEIASACLRNGKIWAVQTATIPASAGAPLHTAVQWWRLTVSGSLDGFGRIEDASGANWLGFPSIAVNAGGEPLVGYSLFGAGRFASAGYSRRTACGGDSALSAIHLLKDGEAPYERLDGGGHNRWGDLSQTVVDPSDDRGIWTLQEYAGALEAGNSRWGTWWGEFVEMPSTRQDSCVSPVGAPAPARVRRGSF